MSDASSQREWHFCLDDMIEFAERAMECTDGLDQAEFVERAMTYDATVRNIELIGEAASRNPESVRAAAAQIPWRQIFATRNRLIHA